MNEDDEEIETPTKRKRASKKEKIEDNGGFVGQTAAQFKVEGEDHIDLDDDDLYDLPNVPAFQILTEHGRIYA
jgi:hypothetical protein